MAQCLGILVLVYSVSFALGRTSCPWLTPTNQDNVLQCNDGTPCNGKTDGWDCCKDRFKRRKCPRNNPIMCAKPDCVYEDYCCYLTAAECIKYTARDHRSCNGPVCTGSWRETDKTWTSNGNKKQRPASGTKCVNGCINQAGRWGLNWCWTEDDSVPIGERQWGAECVLCTGDCRTRPDECGPNQFCNFDHGKCHDCPDSDTKCPYVNRLDGRQECQSTCKGSNGGFFESETTSAGLDEEEDHALKNLIVGISVTLILILAMLMIIVIILLRRRKNLTTSQANHEIVSEDPPPPYSPRNSTDGKNGAVSDASEELLAQRSTIGPRRTRATVGIKEQVKILPLDRNRDIPRDAFETTKILGSGNFGTVYEGTIKRNYLPGSKNQVAIKTIISKEDSSECQDFQNEIKIMSYVNPHLNLVNMIASCTSELVENGNLWLLIEFCQLGDLKKYLVKHSKELLSDSGLGPINSRCLLMWTYDIANGMKFLMEANIMHGDLAARNIMLDKNPLLNGYPVAKVADFGLSKNFYEYATYEKSERLLVPWRWMALEYLTRGYFTLNSDVWSFGVLVWEILSLGRVPYGIDGFEEILKKLESGYRLPCPGDLNQITTWSPQELYNELAVKCFKADPDSRGTFTDVVNVIESYLNEKEKSIFKKMTEEYETTANRYVALGQT